MHEIRRIEKSTHASRFERMALFIEEKKDSCKALKIAISMLGLICATPVLAGSQGGKVIATSVDNNGGPYIFMVSGTYANAPSCAAVDGYWVIPTSSNANAQLMVATILTAAATGKTVQVEGTGTCPAGYGREIASYVVMQ